MKNNLLSVLLFSFLLLPASAMAQSLAFQDVVGHAFGERITMHHQAMRYLEHLANNSDRVVLFQAGQTVERRQQQYVVVTSPQNHARLDEIRSNAQRLNDPRTLSQSAADEIIRTQPSIFYFGGSIHGFELSGSEAALKLLERLVVENTEEVQQVLANSVVIIDPMLNPDGRDAFAMFNHQRVGQFTNHTDQDWNNDFNSWLSLQFRTSHYHFDLNRDWFAHTHPETRGRVPVIREWRPQAGVDAHEMGSNVEFYFDPPDAPWAPYFPEYTRRWFNEFGQAHADAFDQAGYEYMSGERYNFFYPAYTTSFLTYQGAVGMLYEQGSTRGLAITRPDGTVRTLEDALMQQFTAGWAAVRMTAARREEMLQDYYRAHREAIDDGMQGIRRYVITEQGDPNMVAEVVNMLMRNGIEVHRMTNNGQLRNTRDRYGNEVGTQQLPAGTYVVEAAQPRNRFLRTLLEPSLEVPQDFLATARERIDRAENPRFYDITAWSVPLLYNISAYSSRDGANLPLTLLSEPVRQFVDFPEAPAGYAYLIDGSQTSALSAATHMRGMGYRMSVMYVPTQVRGQAVSRGTMIFRVGQNPDSLHSTLRDMADRYLLDVVTVDTGFADPGFLSLGSGESRLVNEPDVAIIASDPVNGYSFGWAWHTLDYVYDIPTTIINNESIGSMPLDRFTTIVLPQVNNVSAFVSKLGENGVARLQRWVREGGTLVTIGVSADVARDALSLTDLESHYDVDEGEEELRRFDVPGAFFKTDVDTHYWLSSGYEGNFPVLVNSSNLYRAPQRDAPSAARRPTISIAQDSPLIAGHAWPESLEQLPGTAIAYEQRAGTGRVISLTEDVNFRGYWRGADRLFLNAVILGPGAP